MAAPPSLFLQPREARREGWKASSIFLSSPPSLRPSVPPSLSICLSIYLSIYLSISIYLYLGHSVELIRAAGPVPNPTFPFWCSPLPSLNDFLFQEHSLNAHGMGDRGLCCVEGRPEPGEEEGPSLWADMGDKVLVSSDVTKGSHSCSSYKHWFWSQTNPDLNFSCTAY